MSGHTVSGSLNVGNAVTIAVDGTVDTWNVDLNAARVYINKWGASPTIRGIVGGVDGRVLFVFNTVVAGATSVSLVSNAISSPNKLLFGSVFSNINGTFILSVGAGCILWYDGVYQGWRILSGVF